MSPHSIAPQAATARPLTYKRYPHSRFWAVYDGEALVCVTVYKKGAQEVVTRLQVAKE